MDFWFSCRTLFQKQERIATAEEERNKDIQSLCNFSWKNMNKNNEQVER